jgi:ketosteroid isomerase-like protein
MNRLKYLASIGALCAVLNSCSQSQPTTKAPAAAPAADTAAIRKMGQDRLAAISEGNSAGYLAAYADDAVLMPPEADDIVGKEVATQRLTGALADTTISAQSETVEQEVLSPDWVLERGSYTVVRTPKAGGTAATEVGTYLTMWKRQADSNFKIAYDIWHNDRPQAPGK